MCNKIQESGELHDYIDIDNLHCQGHGAERKPLGATLQLQCSQLTELQIFTLKLLMLTHNLNTLLHTNMVRTCFHILYNNYKIIQFS